MNLLDFTIQTTNQYIDQIPKSQRKKYGQFFTSKETAIFMADLGLLQPNANYLFVKRFTAKEEHRRLQCGVYLARKYPEYANISTQNKINFISGLQNLSECIVYGLYVLFNSTLYDCYYRILNGSTQVNSTEINSMPVPPLASIESMGKELIRAQDMTEECCDQMLRGFIYEQSRGSKSNTERVASAS